MVLTRGRQRRDQEQEEQEEREARRARLAALNWMSQVLCHAPVHVLGHFLDRKDFAALQTTSTRMQDSVRKVLRSRNDKLPAGKRMGNLGGAFCVWRVVKEVLKREDRHPGDLIATGGFVRSARHLTKTTKLHIVIVIAIQNLSELMWTQSII